ncbi:M28 family peptidase [Sphingomonas sp. URHD0057]|uniref:M28 family peptidase n=1 Tax=Sphingomonas sp. URHD0057 TaxID=1380389 RepID=UPI000B1198A0|nr:M28 family peptidase [Sphingomonas sp. URHD0057]
MANWLRALLVFALLLAGFALKGVLIAPPTAPAHVRAGEFDTSRAATRLQRILGDERPHPVDSAADDAVRTRLIAELRASGLQPQVHETMDCSAMPRTRAVSCSRVRNVIATIPSRRPGRQLLLNAHYDSTPTGPGAGDDGLGVAVLLEVGSILKANPPPRPVTLLFNEGEEYGLNGAHAFVSGDSLARQVDSLINIDVRGVSGPALMYETSDPNGAAVGIYASAARRPYANSISTDFARLIPNTTDVVFFKPRGWTLLNYGIIGNETPYHSPGDTVAALSRDSLGHVGTEVLAATNAMAASADPARAGTGRTVFTDLGGHALLRLPLFAAATALAILLLAALLLGWRRSALGRPLLLCTAMVFSGSLAAGLLSFVAGLVRAGDFWRAYPLVSYLALYATLLAAMGAIWSRWGRGFDPKRMRAAAWLLILIFGSALSLALPGATIFFLIAPAIALLGIALSARSPSAANFLAVLAILVQFVMVAQLLALMEMLLIDGPLAAVVPLAALAALPAIVETDAGSPRPALLGLLLVASVLWVAALAAPRASAERPLGFSIDYFRDATKGTANWGVATKQAPLPASFPGRWSKSVLPYNGRPRWASDAPLLQTPIPNARVLSNIPEGNGRRVRLMISPGGGNSVAIRFPKDVKLLALGLAGAAIPLPAKGEPEKPLLRCTGRSCAGLQIEVLLGNREPVEAELFSTRFGLPPEGQALIAARPANAMPQYAPDQTITMTRIKL